MPSSRDQHSLDDTTPSRGRRGGGRSRSVLVTALVAVIVALVAVTATVLIMAPRGREAVEATGTSSSEASATTTAQPSSSPTSSTAQITADGCLGGAVELNRAVISAQEQAPLTEEGAAAFTATLLRWTNASPAPAYKADTTEQILSQDATTLVRDYVAAVNPANVTTAADFRTGRFYIESYTPTRAVVSFLATATGTQDGTTYVPATISGAVVLVAQNGTWHFQDLTSERAVSDLTAVSSPYTGGC